MRKSDDSPPSGGLLLLIIALVAAMGFGLSIIWMSINRSDITWRIGENQKLLRTRLALHDKLEIERDRLLSPDVLRETATRYDMHQAMPGQVRKLPNPARSDES